ncbi:MULTISPECIES: NADP-dependent oxidoreductase [unclassified Modestobacter]|uniref:NADP-dependent oxidoreductase n=1 Tax=unclassified Modestobacter TaxID=2643866 RepID=UPI0022AAA25F|nr:MULTISPECIES: NADP-dependent oxidoreductase [unclassified Modestobacter]MCZ2810191.1 NADP-dependent oxidoreductase [Modestobacter sp. VKM Ac-2979]MCZ2841677.1 NADP-dependent oxidoreductase [Modestobacter sp. VKM Ac-2980]MCZ2850282.1 NADP-dependent oxidoreductase [Modestobacter sp. VKM Ac-2978]
MRGIAYDRFGDESVLQLRDDLPEPPVGPDTVLVRTRAAGVNPVDMGIRAGGLAGFFPHHFPIVPGWDLAGVVEQVGPAVVDFAPGDEVFGYLRRDDVQWGTTAELVPAPQRCIAHKPDSLGFTEAAALPLAGLTAYQALTEALDVGEGDRVLVHRAAGGVGFFAVQIAAALGAHVIGTASPRNHGFLTDAGAAEVLDYNAGPISGQLSEPVDAVLDLVGGPALGDAPDQVRDPSRIASVVDPAVLDLGGRYVFVRPERHDLEELGRMADAGQLRVAIAKAFPLAQTADAQRLVAEGHVRGKVVITLP